MLKQSDFIYFYTDFLEKELFTNFTYLKINKIDRKYYFK